MNRKAELTLEWSNKLGRNVSNLASFYVQIWRNRRPEGGMRLTPYGATLLEQINVPKFALKIKNTQRTGHTVLSMDRYLDSPYFIDNRTNMIVVYDEQLATQLMLYDGDLSAFLDAFIQNRS